MRKYLILVPVVLVSFILILVSYVKLALPNVGAPEDIHIEITQQRLERGAYLANAVMACMDCHSARDWGKFAGPLLEGTLGQGGEEFTQEMGFPGHYIAPNITPYALKEWTDGEIVRAITEGVSKDGRALFPVMPHPSYGTLDREDIYSVVAYIRTLQPIEKVQPAAKSDFPMNLIINMIPQDAKLSTRPASSNEQAYGGYLFRAAACTDCHTMMEKGKYIEGMRLAGGMEFVLPSGGIVRSANITPHTQTGIGTWTQKMFIDRFRVYSDSAYVPANIKPGDYNTYMPWSMYSQMNDEDLAAIFAYLQTVKPIEHRVIKFTP